MDLRFSGEYWDLWDDKEIHPEWLQGSSLLLFLFKVVLTDVSVLSEEVYLGMLSRAVFELLRKPDLTEESCKMFARNAKI